MKQKIDLDLQDFGSKINAQVMATTASLNDAWRSELITLNLPNGVLNGIWLETAYFGVYLLQKRFSIPLGEEKKKLVNKNMRDSFLLIVPSVVFGSEDEEEKNALKEYLASEYDKKLEMYENFKGVDVKILFRDLVKDVFNTSENSKMKFMDNTLGNRLRLKTALFLATLGGNTEFIEKHENEVYLPDENLVAFATSATQAFARISENDMND